MGSNPIRMSSPQRIKESNVTRASRSSTSIQLSRRLHLALSHLALVLLVVAVGATANALPVAYSPVDIHPTTAPAGANSVAGGVNGQLIVGRVDPTTGPTENVLWNSGNLNYAGSLGAEGARTNVGGGLNIDANGTISGVGVAPSTGQGRPFVGNASVPGSQTYVGIANPNQRAFSQHTGYGLLAGAMPQASAGVFTPALWDLSNPTAQPLLLSTLSGLTNGAASDVARDFVLGSLSRTINGASQAVYWDRASGAVTSVGNLGNTFAAFSLALTDDVWVGATGDFSTGQVDTFLFDVRTGAVRILPNLGGGFSLAHDSNDQGLIVGQANLGPGVTHGVVWELADPNDIYSSVQIRDLAPLSGDDGAIAFGVNDAGLIVGRSSGAGGSAATGAVVWLAVPEPSGLTILGVLGLLGLGRQGRRKQTEAARSASRS